ncbi:uncharacterized protein LOC144102405 [Amblyomma americanum]|uniref:Secreted protein n=1 Tax=Amblyomma americanum TaxID=6943 RepID=A0AAQ4D5R2_AMBAM
MKLLSAAVVCLGILLLASPQQSESKVILAKLGLLGAPFVWAGNVAKDAAQTLVAYKLSLATKALAMITGNRSFKATIAYNSQLERYEEPHGAAGEHHHDDWSERVAAITAAPSPVHVENDVKVDWLPGVAKPVIRLPSLPPLPNIIVPKVVVPKIVVPPVVVPDLVKTKVALLNRLGRKSASILGGGPKHASAYIQGGFRVGHGNQAAGSHSGDVKLGSGQQQVFAPVTPTVGASHRRHRPTAVTTGTPAITAHVEENNATVQNTSANVPLHRPTRSVDSGLMGRYFKFIQANDEGRCVALMVCSMAADPLGFGAYGRKVVQFFEGVQLSDSTPMAPYKKASMVGRSGKSCKSRYSACRVNPKYLAHLGESH